VIIPVPVHRLPSGLLVEEGKTMPQLMADYCPRCGGRLAWDATTHEYRDCRLCGPRTWEVQP
jgi:ribosomal protein L40E